LFIQHRKLNSEVGLDGNVQGQAALTAVTDIVSLFDA